MTWSKILAIFFFSHFIVKQQFSSLLTMTRVCICCKYCSEPLSDISFFGFPKSNELLKKWLHAIGVEKKITASSRICSRHFKEDDFRYSLVGGKRFLKHEAIPSLYLNEEWEDEQGNAVADNQNTIVQENQPTNTVISYNIIGSENETLDIVESHIETKRDDELSERLSPAPTDSSEPEIKRKKHLYDVRWEEISTSSVQAKIYWEVAIKKITRQKLIMKTLRQKVRRLEKQILDLQTLVKNEAITDT